MKASRILAISMTLAVAACAPPPVQVATDEAQSIVDAMTYVKSKIGLCYGVVRLPIGRTAVVAVECSKVGL